MSIEKEKSQGESGEYGDKSDEDHGSEQHSYHDEEADPNASWERTQKEDGRPKSSRRR